MNRIYSTPQGAEIIDGSPGIQEVIERFMDPAVPSNLVTASGDLVGEGTYARVYAVGDVAVKISSVRHCQNRGNQPENLALQLRFMSALSEHLRTGRSDVIAPQQYFATSNEAGDHMLGYQLMSGWQPVHSWMLANRKVDGIEALNSVSKIIKGRVGQAIKPPRLRAGVNDLHSQSMHGAHNVMVPASVDDLAESPLCIIDQPRRSFVGHAIASMMPKVDIYS